MKRQLLLSMFVSQLSVGSCFYEDRVTNESPNSVELFEKYKKIFAAFFCEKALAQKKHDIAHRCGNYGLGNDWASTFRDVQCPNLLEITNRHGEVLHQVARDMVNHLPDIADWLKQNAK